MFMKKLLICILSIVLLCAGALAEGYPESDHPYASYADQTWSYTHPEDAYALKVVFSSDSALENNFDKLYITDASGAESMLTGDIGGSSLWIKGNSFTLRLTSDGSVNHYGFAIDSITGYTQEEYENRFPESAHPYANNTDDTWTYTHPEDAYALRVAFSGNSYLNYNDYIYITDAQGNTKSYTDGEIGNAVAWVQGNSFTLRMTTNDSGSEYGFAIDSITAYTQEEYENRLPESEHPYKDNSNQTWTYTHPEDAYALAITFNELTYLENNYDYLYITDAGGETISYTGDWLSGTTILVYGNSFSLRLNSDDSDHGYGFSIDSITAYTQDELENGTLTYEIDESGCIIGYSGVALDLVIPETVNGIAVTSIGDNVFTIPYIRSAKLPEGLTSIGDYAFMNCAIREIHLPSTLTRIGEGAFNHCRFLESIEIPDGVTEIGDYAFEACESLTEVALPAELNYLGISAFCECKSLKCIEIPEGVTDIGSSAFSDCSALAEVVLPDNLATIGDSAFYDCDSLNSITLPDSLQTIDSSAFAHCENLKQINLPDGLTYIGSSAFGNCRSLSSIAIPDTVTMIGYSAFSECSSLSSVRLPDGLDTISEGLFEYCSNLTSIEIPDSVIYINDFAFLHSGLIEVSLPEGLTEINYGAFNSCARLVKVNLPESLEYIGNYAFENCSLLKSIHIPSNVSSLGYCAFKNCASLESVIISGNLTVIDSEVFMSCQNLNTVVLPDSVESIHSDAFAGCIALQRLHIPAAADEIAGSAIEKSTQLLVYSESAAENFAIENGYDYLVVNQAVPRVLGFSPVPAESCVGSSLTWQVEFQGSASDLIAFELYRNDCFLSETDWESIDNCDASFTHTFELPGVYHVAAKVKAANGNITDSLSGGYVHVRANGSADMKVFDAALISADEINAGNIIAWSFKLHGGAGNYSIFPDVIIDGINGRNADCASITFETQDLGSYILCKGSLIPAEGGEYGLSVLVQDDTGAILTADIFDGVQVNAASVQITGINGVGDDFRYYINTETADLHIDLDVEGETEGLLYNWTLMRKNYSDTTIVDQFITDMPEVDYTLQYDGDLVLDVRAYNPETKQYSQACSVNFVVYPMEDYTNSGEGFWGVYAEESIYQAGEEARWYANYDGGYDVEFRFVLYKDGNVLADSDWSESDSYSITLNEPGMYQMECSMRNEDGDIIGPAVCELVPVVESLPESFDISYMSQWYTNSARNAYGWSIELNTDNVENIDYRFELYRNDELYYATDWESVVYGIEIFHTFAEHGVYNAYITFRDADGSISSPIPFEPLEFHGPILDSVTLASYNSILNTGDMLSMNCSARYGVGYMHAQFSLYRDDLLVQTSPMIPMVVASDDDRPIAKWNPTITEAGEYHVTAIVVDENGDSSQQKASNSILVVGDPSEKPVLEYIAASSETGTVSGAGSWTAAAYGGTGNLEYQFALYCDGEEIQSYDWQTNNTLTVNFSAPGYYYVTACARDEDGQATEIVQSQAISVGGRTLAKSIAASADNVFTNGTDFDLDILVLPANVTNPMLQFASSNTSVATVNNAGEVEIIGNGSAVITVSTGDGSNLSLQINVTSGSANTFKIPAAAAEIRRGAFANVQTVIVDMSGHENVSLANRAFEGCEDLRCVLMPERSKIDENVFEGCSNVVLFCRNASQKQYALINGIDYVMVD